MALNIPNLDRIQKASAPLGEAVQKQQTYANVNGAIKGSYASTTIYSREIQYYIMVFIIGHRVTLILVILPLLIHLYGQWQGQHRRLHLTL